MLVDALAAALAERPGASAAELSVALGGAGHDVDEETVHRYLHAAHGRFRCDPTRARWSLAGADPGPPPTPVGHPPGAAGSPAAASGGPQSRRSSAATPDATVARSLAAEPATRPPGSIPVAPRAQSARSSLAASPGPGPARPVVVAPSADAASPAVATAARVATARRVGVPPGAGRATQSLSLFAWQIEALAAWEQRGRRGVVEAVTGTGKTMIGVAAVIDQLRGRGQALVLVPTRELQQQWIGVLRERLAPGTLIGKLGDGGAGSLTTHDVVVAIVNSLRSGNARPIRPHGLLVADECHRYGSVFNRLALDLRFDRRLGLSATYARDDDGHVRWLDPYFGGRCYQLGYRRAIADGVAAHVVVALVGVRFESHERAGYNEATETINRAAARLVERHGVPRDPYPAFIREVNTLADNACDDEPARLARQYRRAVTQRRRLLAEASGKHNALDALAPAIRQADRTIVFTQSIAASEGAAIRLADVRIPTGVIHSNLPGDARADTLHRFASGAVRVVSAPRVLDEGVDIPAADLAIIVGASRSRRQMIQRMGRVLRPKPDRRPARFAVLYVEATVEDPASGAHESFLGELTDVADAVARFAADPPSTGLNAFLSPPAT